MNCRFDLIYFDYNVGVLLCVEVCEIMVEVLLDVGNVFFVYVYGWKVCGFIEEVWEKVVWLCVVKMWVVIFVFGGMEVNMIVLVLFW